MSKFSYEPDELTNINNLCDLCTYHGCSESGTYKLSDKKCKSFKETDFYLNKSIIEFNKLYDRVFDKQGDIKACGRDVCISLIKSAIILGNDYYGDLNTGYMDIDSIKNLYSLLNKN